MTEEERLFIVNKQGGRCAVCGKPMTRPQFAHKIANTKPNRAKFGSLVIDSPLNGVMVCSLRCNDAANVGMRPLEALRLAADIIAAEIRKKEE